MKKTYIIPSIKEVNVRIEQHVCAGSGDGFGGNASDYVPDGTEGGAKDDLDTDTWGW